MFPAVAGIAPPLEKVRRVCAVRFGVGRVEFSEPVGKRLGDPLDVARMQVNVRVALRVYVALRSIDVRRDLDAAHVVCGKEMAGIAGLNVRVAGAPE